MTEPKKIKTPRPSPFVSLADFARLQAAYELSVDNQHKNADILEVKFNQLDARLDSERARLNLARTRLDSVETLAVISFCMITGFVLGRILRAVFVATYVQESDHAPNQ